MQPTPQLSKTELIQFKVGQLLQHGFATVDTRIHTVEAVRMAYMRELRKVRDTLGIPQKKITVTHSEGTIYILRLEDSTEDEQRLGYRILNNLCPPESDDPDLVK